VDFQVTGNANRDLRVKADKIIILSSGERTVPVTVIGEWNRGANSEFAKVQLTVQAAKDLEVVDSVEQKNELEKLGVEWPDPVILGLLDSLMNTDLGPLKNIV